MNNFFYTKLALTNINKHRKTYFPYILTCISTIAMFYMMHFISGNPGLKEMSGGDSLITILNLGNIVIGIFSVIFLFYTNSFLIKRRKKEFGLFNILGMEKKHIARIMIWETFFVTVISMSMGTVSGIVISKLMFLLLNNILHFEVPLNFIVSLTSIGFTWVLFLGIFILTLLNNLRHIHLAKPIELLRGGQVGEKEPKTKWILVLIGVAALASGYYIALVTESPLAALNKFFLAVLLVIIGTFALFTAGTIAMLKLLRKNKRLYYQTKYFISISGMIYRMKQNAVGLANICILSTMVLVMLSTTVSLYIGMEDLLENRYPKEIDISAKNISEEQAQAVEKMIQEEAGKYHIELKDPVSYRSASFPAKRQGNSFTTDSTTMKSFPDISMIELIPLAEFNQLENLTTDLDDNEVLLYTFRGDPVHNTITIAGREFHIKEQLKDLTINGDASAMMTDGYFVVVKDEVTIKALYPAEELDYLEWKDLSFFYGFDAEGSAANEIALTKALSLKLDEASIDGHAEGKEESRESFYSIYGGLFFLGLFLGALFIMATVLIMYYKQISEGYDDKERFAIMQKVGLSKKEIKTSIKSQVLIVFFLPLVTAVIHIAFAFKVITKLLALLNLTNMNLFVLCTAATILIFAVFYALVYILTSREYYKIVS
ncbi:FtsX-like permease family protein [Bacillus benzoevorans]|uniref:Putative ABC transport system permease protein n=1 Tax=Bacillus benzoevorans TaxID=1456 RepID=A0A7X0LWT5_9BACI|nr:ABC transporter permease [Bacillus benzoevorans]MBB6446905.1 putative ABC transport system permease protein [Bacillus benzoevorans]